MSTESKRWGFGGAICMIALGGILVAVQMTLPYYHLAESTRSAIYHMFWDDLCYPVALAWDGVFKILGVEKGQRMAYYLPIFASILVYFGCLGFAIGLILKRAFRFV